MNNRGRLPQVLLRSLAAACLVPGLLSACSGAATDGPATARNPPQLYPNLNLPVAAANTQLTDEEREALVNELNTLRGIGGAGTAGMSDAERLRLLARDRGRQRLSEIEAAQQTAQ